MSHYHVLRRWVTRLLCTAAFIGRSRLSDLVLRPSCRGHDTSRCVRVSFPPEVGLDTIVYCSLYWEEPSCDLTPSPLRNVGTGCHRRLLGVQERRELLLGVKPRTSPESSDLWSCGFRPPERDSGRCSMWPGVAHVALGRGCH
jgi:hypothetical protein